VADLDAHDGPAIVVIGKRGPLVDSALEAEKVLFVAASANQMSRSLETRSASRVAYSPKANPDVFGEWWPGTESNRRHGDFQSPALPTELPGHLRAAYYSGGCPTRQGLFSAGGT
jgi:hypothetical protein